MDEARSAAPMVSPFRTPQQREDERALKRQALLLAAVRMFNAHGFHATSLDDVAASLGVTKPVIYHHLGNKEQVLLECLRMGLAQLRQDTEPAAPFQGTGLERLRLFLQRYAEVIMTDFGRCIIRAGDQALSAESREIFRALKRQTDTQLRALLADAVADGTAQVPDIRLAAFTLAGALNWPAYWHRDDGPMPAAEIAEKMVDLLCDGITGGSPQSARPPETRPPESGAAL